MKGRTLRFRLVFPELPKRRQDAGVCRVTESGIIELFREIRSAVDLVSAGEAYDRVLDWRLAERSSGFEAAVVLDCCALLLSALSPLSGVWDAAGVACRHSVRRQISGDPSQRWAGDFFAGRSFQLAGDAGGDAAERGPGRNRISGYGTAIEAEVLQRRESALQHLGIRSAGQRRSEEFVGGFGAVDYIGRIGRGINGQPEAAGGIDERDG